MSEVENLEDVLERIFQDEKKINKVIHGNSNTDYFYY